MRTLTVFESLTVNGFFAGADGDMGWAYGASSDPEFDAFVQGNASQPSAMLFGRVTYEMMAGYWPTPLASSQAPVVARGMNAAQKTVFSRTLASADWANTTLVRDDVAGYVRLLKAEAGPDLVVLGSGSIVAQLADAGLVDRYQLVVKSVALASGRPLFGGARNPVRLRLTGTRQIGADNVVLDYVPA
jgi:dihydrofolate reductase